MKDEGQHQLVAKKDLIGPGSPTYLAHSDGTGMGRLNFGQPRMMRLKILVLRWQVAYAGGLCHWLELWRATARSGELRDFSRLPSRRVSRFVRPPVCEATGV
jgi:hypothetical protein